MPHKFDSQNGHLISLHNMVKLVKSLWIFRETRRITVNYFSEITFTSRILQTNARNIRKNYIYLHFTFFPKTRERLDSLTRCIVFFMFNTKSKTYTNIAQVIDKKK